MKPSNYKIFANGIWVPKDELDRLVSELDKKADERRDDDTVRRILFGRALTYSDLSLLVEKAYEDKAILKLEDLSKEELTRKLEELKEQREGAKQRLEKLIAEL